ncbi:hypothetical protein GCM10012285_61330 [Streptomyces kronopolitis]|uniref:Uncharacterized protein n=1 Tax=Streptomyces kronopolitis TaxID=1612435 RepID=A0ABQ2K237_9ACTN|nr:hypothetical protein [Streptomyces kronopolitis]GGN61862.1 hypothetical protein GCM10012285_61330 [Streptomyces kronopolitis]
MAVNLIKPDPGEDDEGLADVVELVAVDDLVDDEGVAAQPSRLRAWWAQVLEDSEPSAGPRPRFMTGPELGAYSVFNRAGLANVKIGTVVIVRGTWTLTRRGWVFVMRAARKPKGVKAAPAPAAAGDTGGGAKTKAPVKRGRKSAAKEKGAAKKKAPAKKADTGNVLVAGVLIAGMAVMFVTKTVVPAVVSLATGAASWVADHPLDAARGTGVVVIVFVVIAWTVGGVVGAPDDDEEDHHSEDHDRGAAGEAAEAESPEDREEGQGSEEVEAEPEGGEVAVLSPEEQAERERIRVYEWVRESIKKPTGSGTAVHLRELWVSLQTEGGASPTMADVRALLEGHQIPIRDGVKAPASDKDGATRNRPGVHCEDLPQSFTPLPTQGSNLVRLLPTYQASDQA